MIINQTNWLDRARKAGGTKGPAQADLLEDVNQMVQVADLDSWQYDFLGSVKQFASGFSQAAVAGQLSHASLFNPLNSGVLVFVHHIVLTVVPAGFVQTRLNFVDPAGFGAQAALATDQRWGSTLPSAAVVRFGAQVGAIGVAWETFFAQATAADQWERWLVLPPGVGVVLSTVGANASLSGTWWWKERAAESGEQAIA